ncbi:MAG: tRNA lysidine(34) synthetase TilS [Flavobacteriaceae bacterium]|nr:tRNA lysidine(34) synthetase TilS [Flavobacteriaceae bacterium]
MISDFESHVFENFPELRDEPFLLAVSGGLDSIVLLNLFLELNYQFSIAHCNFKLRGDESESDSSFVRSIGTENNLKTFIKDFNTEDFAKENNLSVQLAARELRYDWFDEISNKNKLKYIVTAHNLNDQLETFLINVSRGTGIDGLIGIPNVNRNVLRPMLIFNRKEINKYALKNKLRWREDSTNSKSDYLRNAIRNNIVSSWEKIDPNLFNNFGKTINNISLAQQALKNNIFKWEMDNFLPEKEVIKIPIDKIKKFIPLEFFIFEIFKKYGFYNLRDLKNIITAETGKCLYSKTHRLLKDRKYLILDLKRKKNKHEYIWDGKNKINFPIKLKIVNQIKSNINYASFDRDKIKFPLTIRKWKDGDLFYPEGIDGKKKLSKFFKDEKINLFDKERQWLLCSNKKIMWIIGKKPDRRFVSKKISKNKIIIKCF